MSCLDRFLVSVDWEGKFSKAIQRCLPRPTSDHSPILVDSDGIRTGPSPFRFELMWLKYDGFKETLKGWWQSLVFHGWGVGNSFFRFFFLFFDCRFPGPQFCSLPSLLAFWVPLCILPVYELESLFLGFFINIFAFYRSKKKSLVFHGSFSFILVAKLKGLKGILKV